MRLVADGVVDREGVAGLARRLDYSERHLNRLITDELGAGPLAIARAQRASTARTLIETTDLDFTDDRLRRRVRQRAPVQRHGPRGVRADAVARCGAVAGGDRARRARRGVELRLPCARPFAGRRPRSRSWPPAAVPGVEDCDGTRVPPRARPAPRPRRRASLDRRPASARPRPSRCAAARRLARPRPGRASRPAPARPRRRPGRRRRRARPTIRCSRRSSPRPRAARARQRSTRSRPPCAPSSASRCRSPAPARSSVASSPRPATPLAIADDLLTHVFPSPAALAALDPTTLPMPAARGRTLVELAAARRRRRSCSTPAPTATSRAPRCSTSGHRPVDRRLRADARARRSRRVPADRPRRRVARSTRLGIDADRAERWRPWRSYALHHLWAVVDGADR